MTEADDFVSMVAHELRTPLASIRAFAEILLDDPEGELPQRKELLGVIVGETERLTRLIGQVLDVSRLESGKAEWRAASVDMKEVIADTVTAMRQVFEERRIELQVTMPDQVPMLSADVDRIIQVVLNLLSNAAKFCEPGKGRVEIALSAQAGNLRVDVRDNGPGIDLDDQALIFDKFCRLRDAVAGVPRGSGLGLFISRMIVQHFGGRLWAESRPGHGSCFSFTLPTSEA